MISYHIWFPMLLKFKSLSTDSGDICFKKSIGRRQASFSLPFLSNENFPFSRKIQATKLPSASGFYDRRSAKGFIQGKWTTSKYLPDADRRLFLLPKNKKIPLLPASLSQFHSWPDNKRLYIIEKALTTHILSDTAGVFLFTSISILLFIQPEPIKTTKA